jgi:hypothetical protein
MKEFQINEIFQIDFFKPSDNQHYKDESLLILYIFKIYCYLLDYQ